MPSLRWFLAAVVAVLIALVGGTVLIERATINRLLHDDAVSTGRNWTNYLAAHIDDLEAIAAGAPPSPQTRAFLEQVEQVGQVFLYKIFDAGGMLRLASDNPPDGRSEQASLAVHNANAAAAVAAGRLLIEAKEGAPPARPPFFSEAYVPVIDRGRIVAVVETYVDQTAKRAEFHRAFIGAATMLGGLIAIAFGAPAAGWYVRKREQQHSDERIHFLANFDALTGLANRAQLSDGLTRALADPKPLAVHFIDIDRFKDINDLLGLDAGDMLIKIVADRLKAVVAPGDIVARLGGDEFAVVRKEPGDRSASEAFAKSILAHLAAPAWIAGHEIRPSASVGSAIAPDHGSEPGRLMKSAELALSKSKSEAPGRSCLFSADLDDELHARLTLERTIHDGLENQSFVLHFQPLFAAGDARLTGFEALIRLPTGDGGFIPPAVFIPVAEKMGLIDKIGAWVLDEACSTATGWPDHLTVAVNLSPAQFAAGDIVDHVARALVASRLRPQRLELEITESLLLHDTEAVMRQLVKLKALGAAIVMDDFGTGYSSLGYLWRFPFDKIKIDQSFLRAVDGNDTTAEKIIRTIVALGRALHVRVTAEGVETARHAEFIRTVDCDEMQGFYFGRPAPVANLSAIILASFRRETARPAAKPPARRAASA